MKSIVIGIALFWAGVEINGWEGLIVAIVGTVILTGVFNFRRTT